MQQPHADRHRPRPSPHHPAVDRRRCARHPALPDGCPVCDDVATAAMSSAILNVIAARVGKSLAALERPLPPRPTELARMFNRHNRRHRYDTTQGTVHPPQLRPRARLQDANGIKVPGVTTLLSKGLPKPALVNWKQPAPPLNTPSTTGTPSRRRRSVNDSTRFATPPTAARTPRLCAARNCTTPPSSCRNGNRRRRPRAAALVEAYLKFCRDWDLPPHTSSPRCTASPTDTPARST